MTLKRQFIIWVKSIGYGSVFTTLLSIFTFRGDLPIENFIFGLLIIFFYALLLTIPIQVILYFLMNKDYRKDRKPHPNTIPILIFYWIILFGSLYFFMVPKQFNTAYIVLLISFVPISVLHLYKEITE